MTKIRYVVAVVLAAFVLVASGSGPAAAVDFSVTLSQLDGKPFIDTNNRPIVTTLASVCETALLSSYQDEPNLPGMEKAKRYWLAKKIHDAADSAAGLSLAAEELALIKNLVAKQFGPAIVGLAWSLLDPASVPK